MKAHLFTLKGATGTVDSLFKKVISDSCCQSFNWDGRHGKRALHVNKLFKNTFFEIFPDMANNDIEKELRKSIEKAHTRTKQSKFKQKKLDSSNDISTSASNSSKIL